MSHYSGNSYYNNEHGSHGSGDQDRRKRNRVDSFSEHRHVRPRRGDTDGDRDPDNSRRRMECRMIMTKTDVAMLIGKAGSTIKRISKDSNAWVNFAAPLPGSMQQLGTFKGTVENVSTAVKLVTEELERGGELGRGMPEDTDKRLIALNLLVPESQVGRIIGRKGATVKKYQEESGAKISVAHEQQHSTMFTAPEQIVTISGTATAVHTAASFVIQTVDFTASPNAMSGIQGRTTDVFANSFRSLRDIDATADQQAKLYEYYAQLNHPYLQQLPEHYLTQRSASAAAAAANFRPVSPQIQVTTTGRTQRGFSAKMVVDRKIVGAVIGKAGSVVKNISQESGAFVHFELTEASTAYGPDTQVATVGGTAKSVASGVKMVAARVGEIYAELNGNRDPDRKERLKCELIVPSAHIGWLIGRQGAKIKETIEASNADISVSNQKWVVAGIEENLVTIEGTSHAISIAVGRIISQLNDMGMGSENQSRRQRRTG